MGIRIIHADGSPDTIECTHCGTENEENVMCECQEYARPVSSSKYAFSVTCSDCGYSGSVELVELHSCDVARNGGRCEDYPCCGHTDGDGCQTLREHTADYWMELQRNNPDWYDYMDQNGWPDD